MSDHRISDPESEEDWGRRRANLRHGVSVDAVALDPICGEIACTIGDLSSTGMALQTELFTPIPGREPLKPGFDIKLRFAPSRDAPEITATGCVMWRTPTAFGLHFDRPDARLSAALRDMARAAVESRLGGSAGERREMTVAQRKVIRDCRRTMLKQVPNIVWSLRTELVSRMRLAAQDADAGDGAELIADADAVDAQASSIGRTIEHDFLRGFAEATDTDETQEMNMAVVSSAAADNEAGDLGLMADEDARDAATIAVLGNTARERFKVRYFELDVRLANVIGHALDRDRNSIAPEVACRILWRGITVFADSPNIRRHLRKAMQERTIPLLGELYDALHATLDQAGTGTYFDLTS